MDYKWSDRFQNLGGNAIREIFKLLGKPGIISFAGGMPASSALPKEKIKEIAGEVLSSDNAVSILQYGATEGYKPYLHSGLNYIKRVGIKDASLENILAVSGGQQGIDLTCKAFINAGDVVLVEEPTYLAALHIFKTYEARTVGVSSGEDGIDMEDLEEKIKEHKPKMLYLVPTFSNPTGKTLSLENRKKVAEITAKYGVILIEDNPYGELRYEGDALPAIKSFDRVGNVVYITSFSKILSPGLRVGLVIAQEDVIRKLTIGKQATDVHTPTLNQAIASAYYDRGYLDPALAVNIPLYKEKRDAMLSAMDKYFPKGVSYTRPQGGLFIWVTLPQNISATAMFNDAIEQNVAYVSGNAFFASGKGDNTFRLNFSNASKEDIKKGIKVLGNLLKNKIGE